MKILVVSHPPLRGELGAGQTALALAEGLRGLGHDAIAWSAADELGFARGAALHAARAAALERVTQRLGPFDVIDAPASLQSRLEEIRATLSRSEQDRPELASLVDRLSELINQAKEVPRLPAAKQRSVTAQ